MLSRGFFFVTLAYVFVSVGATIAAMTGLEGTGTARPLIPLPAHLQMAQTIRGWSR